MKAACFSPLICVAGGIGSGKSVVCRILELLGHEVYDCDSRAKQLMDKSVDIHRKIGDEIGRGIVEAGRINRERLAEIVFSDAVKLTALNDIVHSEVKSDLSRWYECRRSDYVDKRPLFVETALPFESGIDRMVDAIWIVDAPVDVRVARVMKRNNVSREQVFARITSQTDFSKITASDASVQRIINDGSCAVLPQIRALLQI